MKLHFRQRGVEEKITLLTFLPNLVRVELSKCSNLKHLPSLSKLRYLKSLSLNFLEKLEYMEDTTHETAAHTFFPSLEHLKLSYMDDLKGWWKREEVNYNVWQPSFIKLTMLEVYSCRKLASFPTCPRLEKLRLYGVNIEFQMSLGKEEGLTKLREVQIDNLDYLKSISTESLTSLYICGNIELESFSELGETIFKSCFSLRSLIIKGCSRLRSLNGGGWEHLTFLESLQLSQMPKLTFSGRGWDTDDDDDDDEMLWRSLKGSLRSLVVSELEIKTLPKGMRYLTSLQNFELRGCWNLECLPEWINCLSSLRSLRINFCPRLTSLPSQVRDLASLQLLQVRKCPLVAEIFQDLDGDDWLNLRHISTVDIHADEMYEY
ncbi:hypothetical protein RND81_14G229400 [Saponaria officinalis]|uniref:Uncharacterized protein n=1 Tax=Saponaria officinalis TaxID=3572 RepID=A0AAW1GTK0_SAPOF